MLSRDQKAPGEAFALSLNSRWNCLVTSSPNLKAFQFKITELSHFGWGLWDPTGMTGPRGDSSVQGTRRHGWIPKFTSSARIQNRSIILFFRNGKPGNHFWPNHVWESRVFTGFVLLSYRSLEGRLEEKHGRLMENRVGRKLLILVTPFNECYSLLSAALDLISDWNGSPGH